MMLILGPKVKPKHRHRGGKKRMGQYKPPEIPRRWIAQCPPDGRRAWMESADYVVVFDIPDHEKSEWDAETRATLLPSNWEVVHPLTGSALAELTEQTDL